MSVKPLTEHHLVFLSLTGGCTGLSESIHVEMPHCWKSHVAAHIELPNNEILVIIALISEQSRLKQTCTVLQGSLRLA